MLPADRISDAQFDDLVAHPGVDVEVSAEGVDFVPFDPAMFAEAIGDLSSDDVAKTEKPSGRKPAAAPKAS